MPTEQQAPMPEHIAQVLNKYLPTLKSSITIKTPVGNLFIVDSIAVTEIKAVITRRAKSWN